MGTPRAASPRRRCSRWFGLRPVRRILAGRQRCGALGGIQAIRTLRPGNLQKATGLRHAKEITEIVVSSFVSFSPRERASSLRVVSIYSSPKKTCQQVMTGSPRFLFGDLMMLGFHGAVSRPEDVAPLNFLRSFEKATLFRNTRRHPPKNAPMELYSHCTHLSMEFRKGIVSRMTCRGEHLFVSFAQARAEAWFVARPAKPCLVHGEPWTGSAGPTTRRPRGPLGPVR